jgi:hypothetical protein
MAVSAQDHQPEFLLARLQKAQRSELLHQTTAVRNQQI